ncbi:MAG: hypothetical protein ABIB04_02835 [Patescibacteria group bacterium]
MATKKDIVRTHLDEWMRARKDWKRRAEITKHVAFVTGMHPKSVPRAFKREQMRDHGKISGRGRPIVYGSDVTAALKDIWDAANSPCGEILHPIIREYVEILRRDGMWSHLPSVTDKLLAMKEHTVRRRVGSLRKKYSIRKGLGSTKPSALKSIIPIFKGPWKDLPPGNGQLDTVAHCGDTLLGDFIYTLNCTDIATYWIIPRAQWNKGQHATVENMRYVKAHLPFPWLMGHPDTGSEFINWVAKEWFEKEGIKLTRSEPGKKNDNMCVEERNGHVVRKYLRYVRLDVQEIVPIMNEMYHELGLYLNHFMPVRRTIEKIRIGAKYRRTYEKVAQTPYRRAMAHAAISEETKRQLHAEHETLNPLRLKQNIDTLISKIYSLQKANRAAERSKEVQ